MTNQTGDEYKWSIPINFFTPTVSRPKQFNLEPI